MEEDEPEPFYEVRAVINGKYSVILDGLNESKAEILASNLFEIGLKSVVVQKYYLD
jgi:hypothetical protein